MNAYTRSPDRTVTTQLGPIACYEGAECGNADAPTIACFGEEWTKFGDFTTAEIEQWGKEYFDLVTPAMLNANTLVLDAGCGSGRYAVYAARRAKFVEAVDPSDAVLAAQRLTKDIPNIRVTRAGIDHLPFADATFDFVMSLGVLHHTPDPAAAMRRVVTTLKPGGHALFYLYYNLENCSFAYRAAFQASNLLRAAISRLPRRLKHVTCDLIAFVVYLPLVTLSRLVKAVFPRRQFYRRMLLSFYVDKNWKNIRNDSLDRFGTPLEHRLSKVEVARMMADAGLSEIVFSHNQPYWHVVGQKAGPLTK